MMEIQTPDKTKDSLKLLDYCVEIRQNMYDSFGKRFCRTPKRELTICSYRHAHWLECLKHERDDGLPNYGTIIWKAANAKMIIEGLEYARENSLKAVIVEVSFTQDILDEVDSHLTRNNQG